MKCSHDGCEEDIHTVAIIETSGGFGNNMKRDDILLGVCKWHLEGKTPPSMAFYGFDAGLKGLAVAMGSMHHVVIQMKNTMKNQIMSELQKMIWGSNDNDLFYEFTTKPMKEPEKTPLQKLMEPIKDPLQPEFELYSWQKNWYDEWYPAAPIFNKPKMKTIKTSCDKCGGHGKRGNKRCRSCRGSGRGVPMNITVT
jgi:hypothetical protein